jgi:DNA-directed RNA polymerase subunit RPC12/RpoP
MESQALAGHIGRELEIDLCDPCQSIWFDSRENLQLTPGATLALFRVIGEHVAKPAPQDGDIAKCPRCSAQLRRTRDMQRNTRFEYFRCPNNHGRLSTFFEFLKEKDFVKPLTPKQIAELRRNVQSINCSNCGAPINLEKNTDCGHCGSALSMLDVHQAEKLIAQLREADRTDKVIDPALPLALERARRQTESLFEGLDDRGGWDVEIGSLGLVGAGLSQLIRLIRK